MTPLSRDNYPDMTDEQWSEIEAEFDRARTDASKTARKNALKEAEEAKRQAIEEAIEEQRQQLEMNEHEKLQAELQKVEKARQELAAERRTLTARKTLIEAGLPDDKVDALVPMFVAVDDKSLSTTLDTFVKTYQDGVKMAVDAEKQELLSSATPPSSPTGAPVDLATKSHDLATAGDELGAIDALLEAAAQGVPTQ